MKRTTATLTGLVVLSALVLAGCAAPVRGSANLATKDYAVSDFSGVKISSAFKVEIRKADTFSVTVTTDDNILDKVEVKTSNSTLSVGLKSGHGLIDSTTLQAVVTMPALRELSASGASHAVLVGFASPQNLVLDLSGASSVSGEIAVLEMQMDVSGASTVALSGSATALNAQVSGVSHLRLEDLKLVDASINIAGASDATITTTGRLDADLSGASKLYYSGAPTLGDIQTSGLSKVERR